ncbi:MAG: serine/threonine-protein kinase [Chloroflexota bacterium]|nr:serine/threonine-protein kinase [Chloroflexota bacterium]
MLEQDILLQDRYRIVEKLGGGGMGQVYLAHDIRLADKPCAVKEMVPDPHATPEEQAQAADQFHREAAILAHLNHPYLPNVYDYFDEKDNFYLVMDYVEGEALEEQIAQSPNGLPQEMVVEWAIQLCDVLEYLHSQTPPVIFRDMKPANVMITPEGNIKLIDFGVARLFDPGKRTDTLKMGTAGYAPPEQYAGQGQTTPCSDVYALGATLHELLTSADPTVQPFVFTPPRHLKSSISPSLSDVVMRAVNLDPGDRFQTARATKEALQKTTQPRRLRLPAIQRKDGTGTKVMAETAAVPLPQSRAAKIALGALRWTGRVALVVGITLLIAAVVLLFAGTFALSEIVEQAVAGIDWGLVEDANTRFTMTEEELEEGMQDFLELYALDAIDDVEVDFRPPDEAKLSLQLFSRPTSLQARLEVREGAPAIILERMNDVPLYIVGGIISGGINNGFQKAWTDSPLQVTSLTTQYDRLTVNLEP